VGAIGDADVAPTAGAAYVFCELPIAIFQVEIDIICCIQIPEFGTGPVELVTRFTNLLDEPQLIEIWFQLVQPDGVVLDVSRRAEVEVDIGETLIVPLSIPLSGEGPIGDYTLLALLDGRRGRAQQCGEFQCRRYVPTPTRAHDAGRRPAGPGRCVGRLRTLRDRTTTQSRGMVFALTPVRRQNDLDKDRSSLRDSFGF